MKTFFKILFSDPKLDLSSSTAAAESIKKILEQEKIANRFKVIVAIGGLCSTLIVLIILFFCYQVKLGEQTILGAALSTLIAAMALEDATDSQIRLLESLQSKIKNTTDDEMRAKTLDALFKIIDIQSFPK